MYLGRGLEKVSQKLLPFSSWSVACGWRLFIFSRNKNNRKYHSKKFPLQLCCWNVRTLIDGDSRSERRTAVVTNELARYSIGIAALSETRFSGEDQLTESESGYTLFWSGKPEGVKREAGVDFAVKNSLLDKIECPTALYEQIMTLCILLSANRFITMISVYAPTL